jgi:digeranylgeranylglycerophospholipid reductase
MVNSLQCDVLVVGAGPAGSMTARYAAMNGCDTILIEKRQEIGSPVRCGEGLARHFVEDTKLPFDRKWCAQEVKGAKIFSPNGTELTIEESHAGNEVGIVLERDAFDKAVAKEAAKAGARIMLKSTATAVLKDDGWIRGVRVKQLEDEFNIEAKCVVAADGYESQVGRWAGFKTLLKAGDVTGTLQYRLTNIGKGYDFPDYCEFWLGSIAPAGYIWVFPKDETTANVGIGISLDRLHNRQDIKGYLDRWIAKDSRMKHAQPLDMVTGGVSTCAPIKKTVGNGIALVGDAARMIDPITGGGIGNGMTAGMFLGKILGECNEKEDFSEAALQGYEKAWRAKMEEGLYRNWLAKNKLVTLTDKEFDDIVKVLADVGVHKLSVRAILKVLKDHNPELVAKFAEFI